MNILLINSNPVVSRMIDLCTRDEHIVLEETERMENVKHKMYDIVFIDDLLCSKEISGLFDRLTIKQRVLISYNDEKDERFDAIIKKPFLPSEIIELLQRVEKMEFNQKSSDEEAQEKPEEAGNSPEVLDEKETPSIFPLQAEENESPAILDSEEIDKIKALLLFEDEENTIEGESLSDEEYEARKVEAIKEQLIADGLEIINEDEIIKELSGSDNSGKIDLFKEEKKSIKKRKRDSSKDKKGLKKIKKAFDKAYKMLKKEEKRRLLKGKSLKITIKLEDKH